MTITDELWGRLEHFEVGDPGVALSFADRLARDNGWRRPFTDRVIDEYRRFLYLGQIAGHPVTPSDEVDQAWHLHLTYTRSYWEDLCGEVLGRAFHHGPTRGGEAEGSKFDDWYEATRASYRRIFGHEPPADIWPPSEIRFGEASAYVRVNTARRWVIPKPDRLAPIAGRTLGATGAAATLAGCSGLGMVGIIAQSDQLSDTAAIVIIVAVIIALIVLRWLFRKFLRRVSGGRFGNSRAGGFDGSGGCGGCGGCGGGGCGGD